MIEIIDTIEKRSEMVAQKGVLVIKYGAGWCRPCIACAPAFKQLSAVESDELITYATEDIDLDLDDLPEVVRAIPAFHIYKDGIFKISYYGSDISKVANKITRVLEMA